MHVTAWISTRHLNSEQIKIWISSFSVPLISAFYDHYLLSLQQYSARKAMARVLILHVHIKTNTDLTSSEKLTVCCQESSTYINMVCNPGSIRFGFFFLNEVRISQGILKKRKLQSSFLGSSLENRNIERMPISFSLFSLDVSPLFDDTLGANTLKKEKKIREKTSFVLFNIFSAFCGLLAPQE